MISLNRNNMTDSEERSILQHSLSVPNCPIHNAEFAIECSGTVPTVTVKGNIVCMQIDVTATISTF